MKKVLVTVLFAILACGAWADDEKPEIQTYISGRIGFGGMSNEGDGLSGTTTAIALGSKGAITNTVDFRLEGEFSFNRFDEVDSHGYLVLDQMVTTAMLNAYVDFMTNYRVRPYLGLGAGRITIREMGEASPGLWSRVYDEAYGFGLYAGVGFYLTTNRKFAGDVGIRYIFVSLLGQDRYMANINFGTRYVF